MFRSLPFFLIIGLALEIHGQAASSVSYRSFVSVPALVEEAPGKIAYGLSADDFSIKDNGIEQQVQFDPEAEMRPLSLLLVIQTGHNAAPLLSKISRLNDLLDSILIHPDDQVAVITFDFRPRLVHDFATDSDDTANALSAIRPGDSGAALFDAIHLAVNTFRSVPAENRRVILLISDGHDHGSNASDTAALIKDVSSSGLLVYGLSYSPSRGDFFGTLRSLNPLVMTASLMQRNAGQALTQLTGGDFYHFDSENDFENRVAEIAKHVHNAYSLEFRPSNPQPGFHSLQVTVRHVKANVVTARTGYWVLSTPSSKSAGGAQ
jgi:VWFA-related protein